MEQAERGWLMQLQHFSVNDGEGIRTNLFLAGCPLRCAWCCNPEGQTRQNPMTRLATVAEVVRAVQRQAAFMRFSGGGVTFSGGEATAQPAFLRALTAALYDAGFNLALESCACFDFDEVKDILQKMELIFFDIKHMDAQAHRRLTGMDNAAILANICKAQALGVPLVIRIPLIVGANADDANLRATFAFMRDNLPGTPVELLPYHRYGEDKYRKLGLPLPDAGFTPPDDAALAHAAELARAAGVAVVSYR